MQGLNKIADSMEKVYIVKGDNPYMSTRKLLQKMDFSLEGKKVFIKTNLHPDREPSTDVNVVRAVLDRLEDCDIVIGGNVGLLGEPFRINGYDILAREYGVRLLNIDADRVVSVKVKHPLRFSKVSISKTVLDSDYVISAAKLKIHHFMKTTLCLKNLFGCVPGRVKMVMHPFVDEAIHDYMQVIRPDLNIIDGVFGNQCDECIPYPVKSGIVIGGYEPISVDVVGTKCMGINPEDVPYLRLLNYKRKGIKVLGERIEDVSKKYVSRTTRKRKLRNIVEAAYVHAMKLNLIRRQHN
jgi:uncharacterized protein (DUF362 family)